MRFPLCPIQYVQFNINISYLLAKKKEAFRSLLEEQKDVPLDAAFKDFKKNIRDDPRYSKFSSSDKKCEKEFGCWVSLVMLLSLVMIVWSV